MRKIAIEEHFRLSKNFSKRSAKAKGRSQYARVEESVFRKLGDLGEERLKDMDDAGIDVQVLSLAAPPASTAFAERANDELYKVTKKYPERFVGLAALALQDPDGSATELERAVKELGFRGAKINTSISKEYIDKKKYWAIFDKAVELEVPIYLHPSVPEGELLKPFKDYPHLLGSIWGYGVATGLQVMRLICGGVFDEYPELKIILGHLGEALPFWSWRIDNRWRHEIELYVSNFKVRKLMKYPSQYITDNFYMTPSGFFDNAAFMCTYEKVGADRILFAVDYPFESSKKAVQFVEALPIPEIDKEKIFHLNAEKVFSL